MAIVGTGSYSAFNPSENAPFKVWLNSIGYSGKLKNPQDKLNNTFTHNGFTYGWAEYLNFCLGVFDGDNVLGDNAELVFPKGEIRIKKQVTCLRGNTANEDGGKLPINLLGSSNKIGTTIIFDGPAAFNYTEAGLLMERSCSIKNITFQGNGFQPALLKVDVKRPDDSNENDTDSNINGCEFKDFSFGEVGGIAIEFNGRNTKIRNCTFTDTSNNPKTAVWHYFYDIKEDDGNKGENRKNDISGNTFKIHPTNYCIRLGRKPNQVEDPKKKYSDYQGISINNNTVKEGRFLYLLGGKVGKSKQAFLGLTVQGNNIQRSNSKIKGSVITIENCKLSMLLTGSSFNGGNKADHAIYIDNSVTAFACMIDAIFRGFNKQAIVLNYQNNVRGVLLSGSIESENNNFNGKKGVGIFNENGNNIVSFVSDYNQMSADGTSNLKSEFLQSADDPESIAIEKGGTSLSSLREDSRVPKSIRNAKIPSKYGNNLKDYGPLLNWLSTSEGQQIKGPFIVDKRTTIGTQVIITRPMVFYVKDRKANLVFVSQAIQDTKGENAFGLILKANCDFYKVGFTSSGIDSGKKEDDHPWKTHPGQNIIDVRADGNKSRFEKCGCAGFKSDKVFCKWDVAGEGKVSIFDCNFKDAKRGICLQIYAGKEPQKPNKINKIHNNLFHSGGQNRNVLIGNYYDISDSKSIGKFSYNNNLADIGAIIMAVKLGDNKSIGDIKIMKTNLSGGARGDENVSASIDLVSGTFNNIYISQNSFNTAQGELKGKMDMLNIHKGIDTTNEVAIVCNIFNITKVAHDEKCHAIGISEDLLDTKSKAKKINLHGVVNGPKGVAADDGVRMLKNKEINNKENLSPIPQEYTKNLQMYIITGEEI